MKLASIAKQTVEILEAGQYRAPSGALVQVGDMAEDAVEHTVLYPPGSLDDWQPQGRQGAPLRIEVTEETTAEAGRRLVEQERVPRVVALNFASAKNPGGGFLSGAKAQEEDLTRCSALYGCLIRQHAYYDANRAPPSFLYTDHIIYSPDVPFFRDDQLTLLEAPFPLSIITAPAPNAGEALQRDAGAAPSIRAALERRAALVLAAAARHDHRTLILGAWGCGVFRNDPREVADIFGRLLAHPRFQGAFERVVFAIYDRSKDRATLRAFQERFPAA